MINLKLSWRLYAIYYELAVSPGNRGKFWSGEANSS